MRNCDGNAFGRGVLRWRPRIQAEEACQPRLRDFSTPEARVAACQREAEPNRRFAPDVYLGVMKVFDSARMARVTMLRGAIARLEALEHEFLFFVEPVPAAAASSTTATTATTASSSRPMCRNEPPASQPASVLCAS